MIRRKLIKSRLALLVMFCILVQGFPFTAFSDRNITETTDFLEAVYPTFLTPEQKDMTAPLFFWQESIDTMTEERVREIVRESYLQSGYNGFGILPASPAFMSGQLYYIFEQERFFEMYGYALDEARKYDMKISLYDEDGWPSGAAGGLVKRDFQQYTTQRLDKWEGTGQGGSEIGVPIITGTQYLEYIGAVLVHADTKEVLDVSDRVKEVLESQDNNSAPMTTASSTYATGDYQAWRATDGDVGTRWNAASAPSASNPQWLMIDFKAPKQMDRVYIDQSGTSPDGAVLHRITNFDIEYWDADAGDGEGGWAVATHVGPVSAWKTQDLDFAPVVSDKIRIKINAVSASSPTISEFKVFDGDTELTPIQYPPLGTEKLELPGDESDTWKLMLFTTDIQGNKGLDYLNPAAVSKYIDFVYEEFYRRFPEYFGTTIVRAFYDEPTMMAFREAGTSGNRTWTPNFNAMFEERYPGENPMLYYPAMFEDIGEKTQEARDKLYSARTDMFATNFIKQVNDWCADHGIDYTGHLYDEEEVNPVAISGDLMKAFKYQSIPGVDHISNEARTQDVSRVVSSSAYNWDKPVVMSESFGAMPESSSDNFIFRWTMDEYAAGVNMVIPHAMWYNNKVNVFYPCELSYRSAKFGPVLRPFNEYVARLNQMLQGGRHVADIGIVYPIDYMKSIFVMNTNRCSPANSNYTNMVTILSQQIRRDFTFLHPEIINEKCTVEGDKFKLNNQVNYEEYNTIILPAMEVISLENLEKIKEFYDGGGKVISAGVLPFKGIAWEENEPVAEIIKEIFDVDPVTNTPISGSMGTHYYKHTGTNNGTAYFIKTLNSDTLRAALDDANAVYDVTFPENISTPNGRFTYIHKVKGGSDLYFLANSSSNAIHSYVDIRGEINPTIWDPHTGEKRRPVKSEVLSVAGEKVTRVTFKLAANTSMFIVDQEHDFEDYALALSEFKEALKEAKGILIDFVTLGKANLASTIAYAESIDLENTTAEILFATADRLRRAASNIVVAENLALKKQVEVSSAFQNSGVWRIERLVDGDKSGGGWSSANDNPDPNKAIWAEIDLASEQELDLFIIYPRQDYPVKPFPEDFTIQVSSDRESYKTVVVQTGFPEVTTNDPIVIKLDSPVKARYVKFEGTKHRVMPGTPTTSYGVQITEFEIYNSTPAPSRNMPVTTASSYYENDDQYAAYRATDGDTKTRWNAARFGTGSGMLPQWLMIDFGSPEYMTGVYLSQDAEDLPALQRIQEFEIQYWDDVEEDWLTAYSYADTNLWADTAIRFDTPVTSDKIRLYIKRATNSPSIAEFKVYSNDLELTPVEYPIQLLGIALNQSQANLLAGETQTLTAVLYPLNAPDQNVEWSSSDEEVATVDADGTVHAVAQGVATITVVTSDGGYIDECVVTVSGKDKEIPVTKVKINASALFTLSIKKKETITAIVEPSDATDKDVTWISTNPNIFTVDKDGNITPKKQGLATLTAQSSNGLKSTIIVRITA